MKRRRKGLYDPAYEIIRLLRTKGFKAKLLPPDDVPGDNTHVEDTLKKIRENPARQDHNLSFFL